MLRGSWCLVQVILPGLDFPQNEQLHGGEAAWIKLSLYTNYALENELRV